MMNQIKRKISSKSGASMLLAMVFMLFCVLIGGTVLAASSANGYRLNRLSDSQTYLDQRSAALLMAQELQSPEDTILRMSITDVKRTVQPVKIGRDGTVTNNGKATTVHNITVQLPEGTVLTPVQRVMMETAVWQYLKQAGLKNTDAVTLSNFICDDGGQPLVLTDMDEFWYQYKLNTKDPFDGTMTLNGDYRGQSFVAQKVYFSAGEGENQFDFKFEFGEQSPLSVAVDATFSKKTPVSSSYVAPDGSGYARITTQSTQTAILWGEPDVQKGGN